MDIPILSNSLSSTVIRFVVSFSLLLFAYLLFLRLLKSLFKKLPSFKGEHAFSSMLKALLLSLFLYSLRFSAVALTNNLYVLRSLTSLALLALVWALVDFNSVLVTFWMEISHRDEEVEQAMARTFKMVLDFFVYSIALFVVLRVWGVEITTLLASFGVAGVAVALAVQTTFTDLFSGLAILGDKSLKVGEIVEFDDGTFGVVDAMSFRSVRIKTYDNDIVVLPNSKVASSKITIHTRTEPSRTVIKIGVEYGSDVSKVKEVALRVVNSFDEILKNPAPSVYFYELGDFSLNFNIYYWVPSYKKAWGIKEKVRQKLYEEFNKEGISFAFPSQTIYLRKDN